MTQEACIDCQTVDDAEITPLKSENPSHSRLTIKNGAHFLVLDENGMLLGKKGTGYGLYCRDTRHLSHWELWLSGQPLRLLSSKTSDALAAEFVYGNNGAVDVPEQTILLKRELVIAEERLHEKLTISNYGLTDAKLVLDIRHSADFVDMFEVRGSQRPQRGVHQPLTVAADNSSLTFAYRGLDQRLMFTRIEYGSIKPTLIKSLFSRFELTLAHGEQAGVEVAISTELEGDTALTETGNAGTPTFAQAASTAHAGYRKWRAGGATIKTSDEQLNRVLERGYRDIYMLRQPTPQGTCLAAGIPWFTVAFGRDQCVTGLQTLPFLPSLTREVICVLASYQATMDEEYTAQQVGKIMHELRLGEMARLREIPFIPYYGTVDATQLWLMLLCRYVQWTGDLKLARRLWQNVRPALRYLARATKGGYIRYGGVNAALTNQGWKDSGDSVMYSDGRRAKPSIAICEAQGYLYESWVGLSQLAAQLGYGRQSRTLARKAGDLKKRFNIDFWMPEKQYIALALDGDGRQCDVVSSNPGHLLDSGILEEKQRQAVALRLGQADMFCGWGLRTLSSAEAAYNPMSYHNGSVWPHDNSLAMRGLCQSGHADTAHAVLKGMLDATRSEPDARLPELFCGFDRSQSPEAPIRYPVSCVPQAWAAGTMFMMLASCLGIAGDAAQRKLIVSRPSLPAWLEEVNVEGLQVGNAVVNLLFTRRFGGETRCTVARIQGDVTVDIER